MKIKMNKKLLLILVASGTLSVIAVPAGNYGAMTRGKARQLGDQLRLGNSIENGNLRMENFLNAELNEAFRESVNRELKQLSLDDLMIMKLLLKEQDIPFHEEDRWIKHHILTSSVYEQLENLRNNAQHMAVEGQYMEVE